MRNKYLKVALYIRSTKKNKNEVKRQENKLLQLCDEYNYLIYDFYVDNGYKSSDVYRPAFNRMLEDVNKRKVDLVIACNLNRFYENCGDLIVFNTFIEKNNCKIDTIDLHTTNTVYTGLMKLLNVLERNKSNE